MSTGALLSLARAGVSPSVRPVRGRVPRSPVESYMFANTGSDDVPDLVAGGRVRE